MEHNVTWWSFLPGYRQIVTYLQDANEQAFHAHSGVLFGRPLMAQHLLGALLVVLTVLFVAWRTRVGIKTSADGGLVPSPKVSVRNFIEVLLEALYNQARLIIGPDASRYFPVVGTLALFIFFSNLLGLIPGFTPPTDNWNTTFACSSFVFLYFNWHGLRAQGLSYITHLANPTGLWWGWFLSPLLFPIEVVSTLARPGSLAIRLAANMVGDHAVIGAMIGLLPLIVPLPFMVLGLVVAVVQTLVFVFLTMIYISLSVSHGHEEGEHGHAEHAHA